jgi:hypothetical protein
VIPFSHGGDLDDGVDHHVSDSILSAALEPKPFAHLVEGSGHELKVVWMDGYRKEPYFWLSTHSDGGMTSTRIASLVHHTCSASQYGQYERVRTWGIEVGVDSCKSEIEPMDVQKRTDAIVRLGHAARRVEGFPGWVLAGGTVPVVPSPASAARLPFRSVQFCTDSAPADGRSMTMDEISFHRLKAERCARLANDEPDTRRKLELETEGTLWLELADAEERLDEVRKKVQSRLNAHHLNGVAFAREPSRQGNPIKGLDLDDPEARQRFIQGE